MDIRTKIKRIFKLLYDNSVVRYVFFGGCTTMVNLISFYLLRKAGMSLHPANIISIILAVLFAYVVNSRYVFQNKCSSFGEYFNQFVRFIGARLTTMVIEVAGVWLLVDLLALPDMIGKFLTQFIVLVLNYVFSRFFVFTSGKKEENK